MLTSKNRITRRTLLRGAGHVAIGLPFLEAMLRPLETHAQASQNPLRLVVFFSPGGTLMEHWRPTGTETQFTLSEMMAPLVPHQQQLIFLNGLNLSVTQKGVGHPHSRGMAALLTGTELLPGTFVTGGGEASFAAGPSVDQIIGERVSADRKFRSLEFSTAWAISGRSLMDGAKAETSNASNQINYSGRENPIPPMIHADEAFNRIFKDTDGSDPAQMLARTKSISILDKVQDQYTALSAKLSGADRTKLEEHLELIRQMELSLNAGEGANCVRPDAPTAASSADVPSKGKTMTDLLVSALACDMTRVATMQWADSESKFPLGFAPLNLSDHHHGYQHDSAFDPDALFKIHHWFAQNFAYLVSRLASVQEGDTTLLDNTVVLWVTEIQHPPTHDQTNMPFVLAGGSSAGLRTGRWLEVPQSANVPHNNLLVTLLNLFGGNDTTFGDSEFCSGAFAGLT
jgi:hypothetical protein